ncbi:hypothetical protein [Acinetobacter sp. CFCC 10889]|uniref:hypothetical protein n=1 Tax=Acinetobacter sp. CFCC 10889 TaxID=1775557 RepID=UPI000DCFD1F6|nr:hypothetical protein [Acinetobacter sp. CFCC 10889]
MALVHDFVVLDKVSYPYSKCDIVMKDIPYDVSIHDDFILYFMDYLKWIPTYSPIINTKRTGLDYYAITVFETEGAIQAYALFSNLINILKISPDILKLNGSFSYQLADDEDPFSDSDVYRIVRDSLKQKKVIYPRDKLIEKFEKLAQCFKRVIDSNGQLYVLHMGI